MKFFSITSDAGVATVVFNRPPVNAVSYEVYPELRELLATLRRDEQTRCVVLTSPPDARAWCGGADLNDFMGLDYESRMARYKIVDECFPEIYNFDRPLIAAINKHVVGVGGVLASFCDIRVAAENSFFAMPEIDRGVVTGGMFFQRLNMPQGTIREIIYTGRRLTAEEMREAGFYRYVVPQHEVLPKAMEIANLIAKKNLFALQANKASLNESETLGWEEAYHRSHEASAQLTANKDTKDRIQAFFDKKDQHASGRR